MSCVRCPSDPEYIKEVVRQRDIREKAKPEEVEQPVIVSPQGRMLADKEKVRYQPDNSLPSV